MKPLLQVAEVATKPYTSYIIANCYKQLSSYKPHLIYKPLLQVAE